MAQIESGREQRSGLLAAFLAVAALLFFDRPVKPGISWSQSSANYPDPGKVQKVLGAIERIQSEGGESRPGGLRSVSLTESELNAYIAYRILTDRMELLKELQLKLLDDNRFEGKAVFDLSQENLPEFIPREAQFFFAARFWVDGGKIHFSFQKIFLGGQELPVDFVSEMIKAIALAHHAPAEGLNRSYDLPFGIRDVKSKKGMAIFYY